MKTLQTLLKNENLPQFLEKNFTRLPFSSQGGAEVLGQYLDWKVLEDIMDAKKSILRVVKDGIMVKDYATFTFEEAKKHYQQGNTLLIKNAELSSPFFKHISDDFARDFHTEVDVQLYCTPDGHNAFGWHYDVEEVFIIQAKGSKLYSIRPNTVHPNPHVTSIPKNLGYENEKSDLEIKVLLKEGDWLYIPSGWWHIASTQSESMHISIGLMPRSAIDIASYLPKYLAQHLFWRTRIPLHQKFSSPEEELAFYQEAFNTLACDLEKQVKNPEFIKSFLRDNAAK